MKKFIFVILAISYSLLVISFVIFSYTQVDLNLTLSSNSIYQNIQKQLTYIGYFNRPFSTIIFSFFLLFSTFFYFFLLKIQKKLSLKQIWFLIISSSLILTLSYPAFAHDIFNYMFDTRTLILYSANPYVTTPLDFPGDLWIRFMRWTHVSMIYPPGWLITTIPFYLLGFGKFTLTLVSYKLLGTASFLASSWLILKIAGRKAWILWSFNPMILIESLSSVHNEITMTVFMLLGSYLYQILQTSQGQSSDRRTVLIKLLAFISLIWGGLIKYTSFLIIPFLNKPLLAALAAWTGAMAFFVIREINPWYILPAIALSLISKNSIVTKAAIAASILIMYRYYPCVAIFSC